MNAQEIFDTVVAHLRKQGRAARKDGGGVCLYRTDDGLKCAIGCLIPDGLYVPTMEGKPLAWLIQGHTVPSWFECNYDLLVSLQQTHDCHSREFGKRFEELLKNIAQRFRLVYTPPTKPLPEELTCLLAELANQVPTPVT